MKLVHRPAVRIRLLVPAAVLIPVLSGLAAGCSSSGSSSSSKPAYCADAADLKTSVSNLGDVNVAKNGVSSLQPALTKVQTNAKTFAADAKSAYPSQTTALQNSLSGLENTIKSVKDQPSLTAAAAVASSVAQVKSSASALQSAVSGKCS